MRKRRTGVLTAVAILVCAAFATAAYATSDPWFSGNMAAGLGYASSGAHSISYIQGSADSNGFCVAKDQGISGYDSASRSVAGTRTCATSGGFASRTENSSCCFHGWADNGTGSAIVFFTTTHYDY
jgi:hypothetical protein